MTIKRVLETEPPWGVNLRVRWAMCERIRLGALGQLLYFTGALDFKSTSVTGYCGN